MSQVSNDEAKYLPELMAEKDSIDPSFLHSKKLLDKEISRVKNHEKGDDGDQADKIPQFIDPFSQKGSKLESFIKVPSDQFPSVNFVGRLIGPGGATLKGIQDVTRTRIAVLGKGSQRDKKKAEELAASGDPKWAHMKLPLHVKITAVGPADQNYMNIGRACSEILKLLQVEDEGMAPHGGMMGQQGHMQGSRGSGRGGPRGRGSARGAMGAPRGRGGNMGGGSNTRGRGNATRGTGGRGNGAARGSRGNPRGSGGNVGGGRFNQKTQQGQQQQQMMQQQSQQQDPYTQSAGQQDYSYQQGYSQGYEQYDESAVYGGDYSEYTDPNASYASEGYDTSGYMADGSYGQEQYDMGYGYSDGYSADAYGNGAGDQGQYQQQQQQQTQGQQQQQKPYRGKMMRGGSSGRGNGGRNTGKPY